MSGVRTQDSLPPSADKARKIGLLTIIMFLIGQRTAIEKVAASSQGFWLGLGFVFLAGFFREYDQEDLVHEPWYLFIPFVASLVLSLILFSLFTFVRNFKTEEKWARHLRRFITCFWMCGPMAALYAIPVETLCEPVVAIQWNIAFLGIVSIWRVLLICRVMSVLYPVSFWQAFVIVMLLADTIVLYAMFQIRIPLIQVMGGIQLSETEQIIANVRSNLLFWGLLSWPVWLIQCNIQFFRCRSQPTQIQYLPNIDQLKVSSVAWTALGIVLMAVLALCTKTQPLQQRAHQYESYIKQSQYQAAVEYVARFEETDFPPNWDPPPRPFEDSMEEFMKFLDAFDSVEAPQWFRDRFGKKLIRYHGSGFFTRFFWQDRSNEELVILSQFLRQNPQWISGLQEGVYSVSICEFIRQALHELKAEQHEIAEIDCKQRLSALNKLNQALAVEDRCYESFPADFANLESSK